MKYFLSICCFLLILACSPEKIKLKKPSFLIGNWERINEKPGKKTFDIWNKNLNGVGFTLQENDTVFKEIMSIVNLKDTLYLKVEAVNEKPTLFKFTEQTDTSFVCKNLENEFPKTINYFTENNNLKCKISNDDFSIDFVFKKIN